MSTQRDIDEYTSREEMEADGWRFTGTQKSPKWQREVTPGTTEYFWRNPDGFYRHLRRRQGNGSGSVTTVVLTRRCYEEILEAFDLWYDGRETGCPLLCTREGSEIYCHEAVQPWLDDYRTTTEMKVYDYRGEARERERESLGWKHAGLIHSHGPHSEALPSDADRFAASVRERKELGGCYAFLIAIPFEDRGGFKDLRGYVSQNGAMYPVTLEVEG